MATFKNPGRLPLLIHALAFLMLATCERHGTPKPAVKIGVLLSQTGTIAPYGKKALEGVLVAEERLRADGIPIDFVVEDAASSARSALAGFEKLATVDRVPLVIGPESSGLAIALAPVANQRHVVLFAPTVATDSYSSPGDFTFRNWPASRAIAEKMADIALSALKIKSVAVIYINNEMGNSYQTAFSPRFERGGGKIRLTEAYPPDTTDFRTLVARITQASPDAIYLVGQVEMGFFLRQLRESSIRTPILSGIAIEDPKVREIAGDLINGIVYTAPGFRQDSPEERTRDFESAFFARFGRNPEIFAACSYDAAMIAGKLVRSGRRTADDFKDGLFGIKEFPGVTGAISFDQNGDVQKPIAVKRVDEGGFSFLSATLEAQGR